MCGSNPSRNLLYALHGALIDLPWNMLPPELQQQLQQEVAALEQRNATR